MPSAVPISDAELPSNPPDLSKRLPKLTPRRRPQAEQRPSNPPPPTPSLSAPPNLTDHTFFKPTRRILSERDHELFLASNTHNLILSFVFKLSDSIRDTTISDVKQSVAAEDPAKVALLSVLDEADEILKQCPPLDTGSRFGNPAFRDYLATVESQLPAWHQKLGVTNPKAVDELSAYAANSFGSGTRIDYGSGHELNFILWLLCLRQLSILKDSTFPALALIVFPRYLKLMRDIQSTYYLEPAGSHGVWGLDDYQFLPFLFGASQLVDHKHLRPLSIHNQATVEECSKDYLYLDQVQWVNATKNSARLEMAQSHARRHFFCQVLGKSRRWNAANVLG